MILVAAPWRIWYIAHGLAGETPTGGPNTERFFRPSGLAFDVLFSSAYWSVLVPIAIGALGLGLLVRAYVPVLFFGLLVLLVTLGGWITWVIPELEITQDLGGNPIVRYMARSTSRGSDPCSWRRVAGCEFARVVIDR